MRCTILALAFLTGAAPLPAQTLRGVKAIAAGGATSFALLSDGTVWAWGSGGGLGDGTTQTRTTPVQVIGLTGVVAIGKSLAVKADGTVWQWGANTNNMNRKTAVDSRRCRQVRDLSGFSTAAQFTKWVTTAIPSNPCR